MMRTPTLMISVLASALALCACVADDPTADTEQVAVEEAALAAVPATPNLVVEFVGCSGVVADYLVMFPSAGATRYDADYRRGAGAWASLSDGAASSARFATSNHTATVAFRARACSASGCSSFDQSVPFRPRACTGSDSNL